MAAFSASLTIHALTHANTLPPVIVNINNPISQDLNIFTYRLIEEEKSQIATLKPGQTKEIDITSYLEESMLAITKIKATLDNPVSEISIICRSPDLTIYFQLNIERSNDRIVVYFIKRKISFEYREEVYNAQTAKIVIHINPVKEGAYIQLVSHEDIEKAKQQKLQGERKQLESQRILNRPSDITLQKLLPLQRK